MGSDRTIQVPVLFAIPSEIPKEFLTHIGPRFGENCCTLRILSNAERIRKLCGHDSVNTSAFTGTDRGLLRSVLGPRSPVPKCEAPGAPISVEEHTSMARRQSQNPPLQKSSAIPALPWPSRPRLRYSPGLAPTTRLKALLNAASDS